MDLSSDELNINPSSGAKLARLFNDEADDLEEKLSKKHGNKPKSTLPLKIIIGKTVEAYQLKTGGYASEGKSGLVVLGNEEANYYQIYLYQNNEKKLASADITVDLSLQVQQNNYIAFQDGNNFKWSLHFDKVDDLIGFCRIVAKARWLASNGNCQQIVQDAYVKSNEKIKINDKVQAHVAVHQISPNKRFGTDTLFSECDVEAVANSAKWPTQITGRTVSSRFFIISATSLVNLGVALPVQGFVFLDVEILSSTPGPDDSGNSAMTERMARIGIQLPQFSDLEDELRTPVKVKDEIGDVTQNKRELREPVAATITNESELSEFMREIRANNSEIRLSVDRLSDKIDLFLNKTANSSTANNQTAFETITAALLKRDTEKDRDRETELLELRARILTLENASMNNHTERLERMYSDVEELKKAVEELKNENSALRLHIQAFSGNLGIRDQVPVPKPRIVKTDEADTGCLPIISHN